MESSKHNDELIKRKLDDLSIEPRKLKFAEVKANYDKAKDASSNKWGLYLIFGCIGIAALVSSYFLLTPSTSDQLAEKAVATEYSSAQNIQSVGTTSEDKFVERSDKTSNEVSNANTDQAKQNDANAATNSGNEAVSKNSDPTLETNSSTSSVINKGTNASANADTKKDANTSAKALNKKESNTSTIPTTTEATRNKRSNTTKTSNSKNNILTNPSSQPKIGESVVKTDIKKQSQKASDEKDASENNNNTAKTQPLANSGVLYKTGDQNLSADKAGKNSDTPLNDTKGENTKDIAKNETPKNNNGNTDQSALAQQGSNDQNNNSNKDIANTESKNESSNDQLAKTDSVSINNSTVANKVDSANASSHIPGVIGTGSVSPRNKHKFLIGAEVSYSTLFFNSKENPNSPSQFSTGDPAFTTAYANALGKGKHNLFNGAASLSYVYNEGFGVSTGISYFNLETKVDIQPSRTPEYTTAIDYFVWNWVQDSSVFPPTLSLQIVDTAYKQVATGNYNTVQVSVNGDSASTLSYVNKIRYISIPIHLSYNFKIGAKFSIEPQAGIIYTMPLKSLHLVATDAYKFEYKKQKADLRNNLYFNAALKIGYNINNRTQLYIREGYFFRNNSIYNSDQAISLSLKSIYTSFGITYRLK